MQMEPTFAENWQNQNKHLGTTEPFPKRKENGD
jgi:hypothetical protein